MQFPQRKIIHIDMDAFYASVEQRDNPIYKGKAIAVGGSGRRGVVAAASYEAREFGVRSAMSSVLAYQKCPHIIFVKPRFEAYKKVSQQIREIFYSYTDLVEPLSLDEAYLDVTINKKNIPSATIIAEKIRAEIKEKTDLIASAGVSVNKFLAKVASDINKPNGLTLIPPEEALEFIEELAITKFFGIGKVTAKRMFAMEIHTGADLKRLSEEALIQRFGKMGRHFYRVVRLQNNAPVISHREHKSIAAERTFNNDVSDAVELLEILREITNLALKRLKNSEVKTRTITVKIKYHDFQQITRSKSLAHHTDLYSEIFLITEQLLFKKKTLQKAIRLLGVSFSQLESNNENNLPRQLSIPF